MELWNAEEKHIRLRGSSRLPNIASCVPTPHRESRDVTNECPQHAGACWQPCLARGESSSRGLVSALPVSTGPTGELARQARMPCRRKAAPRAPACSESENIHWGTRFRASLLYVVGSVGVPGISPALQQVEIFWGSSNSHVMILALVLTFPWPSANYF